MSGAVTPLKGGGYDEPGKAVAGPDATRTPEQTLALAKRLPSLAEASFGELMLLARELVPTGFLPEHIKTPGQCVAIILAGRELGMAPMRALRSIQMVKGKITENADSMLARFKTDGGRATFRALDEKGAALWLKHPNGDEHTETFNIEDARRAGLIGGVSKMYEKFPKAMLRSRVITAGLKSIGWEGGAGAYDPEELAIPIPDAGPREPVQAGAPAPAGTWQQRPEGQEAPKEKLIETLEEARALIVPGAAAKWGGHGGKPFGECGRSVLTAMYKWADKLIVEAGTKGDEPEVKVINWKRGAELVLKAMPPEEGKEPPTGGRGTAGGSDEGEFYDCCDEARATGGKTHAENCQGDDLPF